MKESKIKDSRDLKSLKRFSRFRKLQCLKRDTSMQHHAISCNSDQSREDANQQQAPVQGGSIQLDLAKTPDLRLQPDLSFLANATGSKATNTHCGMRFLLAAWHRWGVAQAGPAAIRINLKERGFSKPTFLTSSVTGGKSDRLAPGSLHPLQECTKDNYKYL